MIKRQDSVELIQESCYVGRQSHVTNRRLRQSRWFVTGMSEVLEEAQQEVFAMRTCQKIAEQETFVFSSVWKSQWISCLNSLSWGGHAHFNAPAQLSCACTLLGILEVTEHCLSFLSHRTNIYVVCESVCGPGLKETKHGPIPKATHSNGKFSIYVCVL